MNMRLEDMRDREPRFACHLNINLNIGSRIENRSHSFVVVAKHLLLIPRVVSPLSTSSPRRCSPPLERFRHRLPRRHRESAWWNSRELFRFGTAWRFLP